MVDDIQNVQKKNASILLNPKASKFWWTITGGSMQILSNAKQYFAVMGGRS